MEAIENDLPGSRVIAYSSITGKGRDAIWESINSAVEIF